MPLARYRPWVPIVLLIVLAGYVIVFVLTQDVEAAKSVGQFRQLILTPVTIASMVMGIASAIWPPKPTSLGSAGAAATGIPQPGGWGYVALMIAVTAWWFTSTLRAPTGPFDDSLLSAQLFLTLTTISLIRRRPGFVSMEWNPGRYVFGFIVFCVALLLMWMDTEYQMHVAHRVPEGMYGGWRLMNLALIAGWLFGGCIAFSRPQWLGKICWPATALLVVLYPLFEWFGVPQ